MLHAKRVPLGSVSAFWHVPSAGLALMGLSLLLRGNNRFAVFFQGRDVICNDLPSGFGINSTVAMGYDVSHGLDLPPRDSGMLFFEIVRQFAYIS